jgi:NTP pyrophosphatase (non-canonical NTP hydrolase)
MLTNLNLGRNAVKGHWMGMTWWQLWRIAWGEFGEFREAVMDVRREATPYTRDQVLSELADLCAALMFIADKAGGISHADKADKVAVEEVDGRGKESTMHHAAPGGLQRECRDNGIRTP